MIKGGDGDGEGGWRGTDDHSLALLWTVHSLVPRPLPVFQCYTYVCM